MREPSIHITKGKLIELLIQYTGDEEYSNELSTYLIKQGSRYPLNSRKGVISQKKISKKVQMVTRSYKADAQLFAKNLRMYRLSKKHRGVSLIKEGSAQWNILKEVTSLATQFCQDFELELRPGYVEYIQLCFEFIPNFNLNKVNYNHERLCKTYEAIREIMLDKNQAITEKIYDSYYEIVSSKTGILNDYKKQPLKYLYFVKAAKVSVEMNIPAEDMVKAQFKSLEWVSGLPDPSQLVGDNALDRLQKYMYSKTNKTPTKKETRDLKELLGL